MKTNKTELFILIFLLGLALFNWPLLKIADNSGITAQYLYLFIAWSIPVFLVIVINRIRQETTIEEEKDSVFGSKKKEN